MPIYSYYAEKKLVCIIIMAPFSYQPSSCSKYIKLNMRSFCDIYLVSNAECMFFIYLANLESLQLPYLILYRVLYINSCCETR